MDGLLLLPLHLSIHEIDPIPHQYRVESFFVFKLLLLMVSVSTQSTAPISVFILRTWHRSKRKRRKISKRAPILSIRRRRELNEEEEGGGREKTLVFRVRVYKKMRASTFCYSSLVSVYLCDI
jgi:hypothetical protein